MKNPTSISHFPGKEQQALLTLKNQMVKLYQPLIIYYISGKHTTYQSRSCFSNPRNHECSIYDADFVMVLRDNHSLPEDAEAVLKDLNEGFGSIRLIARPLAFVKEQLHSYSLFFCWLQRRAIVLYECGNACRELPDPVRNMKQYESQAQRFYYNNLNYEAYFKTKLSPLPVAPEVAKEVRGQNKDTPPSLSPALQKVMVAFLRERGGEAVLNSLRSTLLDHVIYASDTETTEGLQNLLKEVRAVSRFFDVAEKESSSNGE